jgi:surface polysaccharide O-acyltransferase-like enzyme
VAKNSGFFAPADLIRTVAIVGVILLHASNDLTLEQMNWFEIVRWNTVTVYQSVGRLGVPLFLLLTGALLLQPSKISEPIGTFFKKRLARIGLPFIFWGAVYYVWDFFVVHQINSQPITTNSIIQGILTGPYYQFWYLYLLLGLYLVTPILRVVIAHAERNLIKYLLILWFLGASLLPVIYLVTPYRLDSNVLTFTSYAGYFILGAYLITVQMRRRSLAILLTLGVALTVLGTYQIAHTIGGPEMWFFQDYLSPTIILASATLFMLLISLQTPPVEAPAIKAPSLQASSVQASALQATTEQATSPSQKETSQDHPRLSNGRKLLIIISANTLPLYLFHVMVLETLQKGYLGFAINGNTINSIVGIPLNTVIVLFVSLGIILALKKVPVLKQLVG